MTLDLAELATLPERWEAEMLGAARDVQDHALDIAILYSSGSETRASLRRAGHPYARRGGPVRQRGVPGYPPEIINTQSGDFASSWTREGPEIRGDDLVSALVNVAPHAESLAEGTERMILRPLPEAVEAEIEGYAEARYTEAAGAVFRP